MCFIEVPVPSLESEQACYIRARGIEFTSVFLCHDFAIGFWNYFDSGYFFNFQSYGDFCTTIDGHLRK